MEHILLDQIEAFAAEHGGLDGPSLRSLVRGFAWGEASVGDLPAATTEAGAAERAGLVAAIAAALAPMMPDAVAGQSAPASVSSLTPTPVSSALPELSGEARAAAIRAMAGPDRGATAEALIASPSVTVADAATVLATVNTALAAREPSASAWWRQPEFSNQGFAGFDLAPQTQAENVKVGWSRAFQKAEAHRPIELRA